MPVSSKDVLAALGALAPLELAQEWDNVGLLIDGEGPDRDVRRVMLTVDLTPSVLKEAKGANVEMVVAYHPPIFGGLKRLLRRVPEQQVVLDCIRAGITVYSPHTALDAVKGGLNDWLTGAFGASVTAEPIEAVPDDPSQGAGRLVELPAALTLGDAIAKVKSHLGLGHVRVASERSADSVFVRRVAVCPGAGGSLFGSMRGVDLYLTGEMRHHDVLAKVRRGSAVILTEHTNCERGYLPILKEKLTGTVEGLEVLVSERDRDPLGVV